MSEYDQILLELKVGLRDHDAYPMIGHFKAVAKGRYDNLEWAKDDVGEHTKPLKDRHGFIAVYVRFKGEKTARLIPDVIFRKFFVRTPASDTNPDKWKGADKGGTKIQVKKKAKGDKTLSKDDKESAIKKATGGKAIAFSTTEKKLKAKDLKKEEVEVQPYEFIVEKTSKEFLKIKDRLKIKKISEATSRCVKCGGRATVNEYGSNLCDACRKTHQEKNRAAFEADKKRRNSETSKS